MPIKKLNILLADDEPEIATVIASVLKRGGHAIDIVNDGREAYTRLQENGAHYHLLITDSNMPEMSGIQLIQELPQTSFRGKIMLLSGYLTAELQDVYKDLPIDKIVQKPFVFAALSKAVAELAVIIEARE